MKTAHLSGSLRANVGKKDAAALRNAGLVPCVLYGQGEQTHFAVKRTAIDKIVFSPDVFQVALDIEGKKAIGIIRELQNTQLKTPSNTLTSTNSTKTKKCVSNYQFASQVLPVV